MLLPVLSLPQRIRLAVQAVDSTAEVILFGSRARGDARPDSDWDFLVLTQGRLSFDREQAVRGPVYELEVAAGEVFSLLFYSRAEWETRQCITPLFASVTEEGISL